MSKYRVKSIIAAYSAITGNQSMQSILDTLKKSYTFNEVLKGDNEAVNYDSTLCNLLDIVDDLKQQDRCPDEVSMINHDSLVRYFASVRAANLAGTDISLDDYAKEELFCTLFLQKEKMQ